MHLNRTPRTILLITAAFLGAVITNFGVNILSPDAAEILKTQFGEGYKIGLSILVFLCFLIAAAWPFLFPKKEPALDGQPLTMPFSAENTQTLADAKWNLQQGDTEKALVFLKKIDDPGVQTLVAGLQTRWSNFKNETIRGILPAEQKTVGQNQINDAVLTLIAALEAIEPPRKTFSFSAREEQVKTIPAKDWAVFRENLRRRYQRRYDAKIEDRIALTMDLTYTQEGFSEPYVERFFIDEAKTTAELRGKLFDAFEKHRSLVVIGDPGAGKTTVMLELALEVLRRSEDDPAAPLPVVFNLASWDEKTPLFRDWLVHMLRENYGVAPLVAERMLLERRVLPFLDGLDELGRNQPPEEQDRLIRACSQSIRQFLPQYLEDRLLLCSRRIEHERAGADLPVRADILVNPLRPEQVREALHRALLDRPDVAVETAALNILHWADHSAALQSALLTPFYFKIAEQVFDERSVQTQLPEDPKAVRDWLTEAFVDKKLAAQTRYAKADVLRRLGWLAANMNRREAVKFELADLQPGMLRWRWGYGLIFGLIGSLIGILVGGLVFGFTGQTVLGIKDSMIFNLTNGIDFGLIGSLALGWIIGLCGGLVLGMVSKIETLDLPEWDWQTIFNLNFWKILSLCAVIGWLMGFLILDSSIGIILGLVVGGGFLLKGSIKIQYFAVLQSPYQRLAAGLRVNFMLGFFMVILSDTLSFFVDKELADWKGTLFFSIIMGLFMILPHCIFLHSILRLCLSLEGPLPLRLVPFLDYAEKPLRFLDKEDGGTWRFRHQILQDYFAEKWEREAGSINSPKNHLVH